VGVREIGQRLEGSSVCESAIRPVLDCDVLAILKGKNMCGTPRGGGDDSEVIGHSDEPTGKLNVTDAVVAGMLAHVAAGCTTSSPEDAAQFAKTVVESLLQFRT